MQRTSINIDAEVFKALRQLAAESGVSQTSLIRLFLTEGIARFRNIKKTQSKYSIPVSGEGGLKNDVDLSERSRLIDLLDDSLSKK